MKWQWQWAYATEGRHLDLLWYCWLFRQLASNFCINNQQLWLRFLCTVLWVYNFEHIQPLLSLKLILFFTFLFHQFRNSYLSSIFVLYSWAESMLPVLLFHLFEHYQQFTSVAKSILPYQWSLPGTLLDSVRYWVTARSFAWSAWKEFSKASTIEDFEIVCSSILTVSAINQFLI